MSLLESPGSIRRPPDRPSAREAREARWTHDIHALLEARSELRGVYAPADLVAEKLCWSV